MLDHHKAKEHQRRQMVNDLNISSGDVVLDLGCGPGLWTSLLAEKVNSKGRVVGLDVDTDFINYAKNNLAVNDLNEVIDFHQGNFYSVPFEDDTFDLVFLGNCFAYVTDHQKVLEEQKRITKRNGRVAVKDFDGSVIVVNPINPELTLKVLAATAQSLKDNPLNPPFDNFSGRKLQGVMLNAGFKNVSTTSYALQILPPLIPEEKRYITGNAQWYANKSKPYLSEEDCKQ